MRSKGDSKGFSKVPLRGARKKWGQRNLSTGLEGKNGRVHRGVKSRVKSSGEIDPQLKDLSL